MKTFINKLRRVFFPCHHIRDELMRSEDGQWLIRRCPDCGHDTVIKRPPARTITMTVMVSEDSEQNSDSASSGETPRTDAVLYAPDDAPHLPTMHMVMPHVVSFSGGQTSGKMLHDILSRVGRNEIIVLFCNTGKEHAKTLDFVRDVETNWGIEIVWLEYCREDDAPSYRVVSYETASRDGEPFDELMETLSRVPNVRMRACSSRLKDRVMKRYLKAMGYETWHSYVGIRADEAHRTTEILAQSPNYITQHFPLVDEEVTREQVNDWWDAQTFKLNIPNHKGNYDLCFLKAKWKLLSIMRENPDSAAWWINWEKKMAAKGITGEGTRWRYGTSYESMLADATHPELPLDCSEEDIPCSCAAGAARDDEEEA